MYVCMYVCVYVCMNVWWMVINREEKYQSMESSNLSVVDIGAPSFLNRRRALQHLADCEVVSQQRHLLGGVPLG